MQKTQNLQDAFLNQARRDRLTVIYKHAISTIVPPRSLSFESDT